MRLFNRTAVILLLVLALVAMGTVGFHLIEHFDWFDSLYATLMSLSTTGAGPLNELSRHGRMFNAVMICLGLGVVGFAIGNLTQAMIEFELGSFFGRRRMEKELSKLHGHFIICGAGRVGRRLAMEVAARHLPVVIIENDPARARWAEDHHFPVVVGDASQDAVLKRARIEHARGLASAVTSDAQNVYIVLTARGLAPNLPIVARASEENAESKLRTAGATAVISPYNYAGQRMARTLTHPNVQRFIDMAFAPLDDGGLNLEMEELQIGKHSELAGLSLAEAQLRQRLGVIVLAIRRADGQIRFSPPSEDRIAAGDALIVIGDGDKLKELETLAGVAS